MKSTSPVPSMFRVPPLWGVPEPGLRPWVPDDSEVEPEPPEPPDDELPLLHAAMTDTAATRPTLEANALERFRIDTLLSIPCISREAVHRRNRPGADQPPGVTTRQPRQAVGTS